MPADFPHRFLILKIVGFNHIQKPLNPKRRKRSCLTKTKNQKSTEIRPANLKPQDKSSVVTNKEIEQMRLRIHELHGLYMAELKKEAAKSESKVPLVNAFCREEGLRN